MRPSVAVDQEFSQRVRGLFAQEAVGGDDTKTTTVLENLKASLDEQSVEVDVATHGGEPRLSVVGEFSKALAQFFSQLASVFHPSKSVLDSKPGRVGQHQLWSISPRPFLLKCITLLNASIEQGFHFFTRNFTGGFGPKTDQLVPD